MGARPSDRVGADADTLTLLNHTHNSPSLPPSHVSLQTTWTRSPWRGWSSS